MITSTTNPLVKQVVALRNRRRRSRERMFVIDGWQELLCAADTGIVVESIAVSEDHRASVQNELRCLSQACPSVRTVVVTQQVLQKMSLRENSCGMVALARMPELTSLPSPLNDTAHGGGLYLYIDHVEKPGNTGALFRTADATGVSHVMVPPNADLYNPNVIRNSLGTCFTVPWCLADSADAIEFCRANHTTIMGADPEGSVFPWDVPLAQGVLLVLGSEHDGLSPEWKSAADTLVKLPMFGKANSLNVSVSGAMLLYESMRQRSNRPNSAPHEGCRPLNWNSP